MLGTMTAPPAPEETKISPADPLAFQVTHVSSLLASRLCHDLVNPVGALSTGLDVLAEEPDADMQAHALSLIKESTQKTIAMLTFARIAFGASGSWEGEIDMGEARDATSALYDHVKADLHWEIEARSLPKARARAMLNILLLAEKSVPRAGSAVRVTCDGEAVEIIATGKKAKLSPETEAALAGEAENLAAKEMPAYLASILCQASGDRISAVKTDDETIVYRVEPGV